MTTRADYRNNKWRCPGNDVHPKNPHGPHEWNPVNTARRRNAEGYRIFEVQYQCFDSYQGTGCGAWAMEQSSNAPSLIEDMEPAPTSEARVPLRKSSAA